MHFQLKKTITHVSVLAALIPFLPALAADGGGTMDPASAPKRGQYVYDSTGINVRSGFTQGCVATGFWTPETATPECHPDLFASPGQIAPKSEAQPQPTPQAAAPVEPAPTEQGYEPAPYEEPIAQSAAPEAAAAPVPEFVQEPEPSDMAPTPAPESFGPESADTTIGPPAVFYGDDQQESAANDEQATRYYDEEEGAARDDGIVGHEIYREEEEGGEARDDGIIAHNIYNEDEEGVAKDDGIIGHNVYNDDDEGAAKDEGITGHNVYNEDDEGVAKDDGIVTHNIFSEDEDNGAKDEGITAGSVYGDDDSGKQPEELISEPKTPVQEETAQAEEKPEQQAAPAEAEQPTAQVEPQQSAQQEKPAAPVTMLPVTITVEADPLFDFDKYAIRSDSKKKLDDLVTQLKGVTYGEIVAVGFADPIGNAIYNENLSKRRAASVKRYLVGKGIPADNIKTEGRGETEEFASFQSCGGMRKQKLIACLQPDRRVEVTVTAEKQK